MLSTDDLMWFVDEALDGLVAILDELGDERANQAPDLADANSAFGVVTHCLGVMEYWGGHLVAGRDIERDRDAEFVATGSTAELVTRLRRARAQLAADLTGMDAPAPPRGRPDAEDAGLPIGRTQGGAAVHVLEELAQHRGQLEITRDLMLNPRHR